MQKFFSICLMLLISMAIVTAQPADINDLRPGKFVSPTGTSFGLQHSPANNVTLTPTAKTDAVAERIIGYRSDFENSGSWLLSDSVNYTYSGNRGSLFTNNEEYDLLQRYHMNGSSLEYNNRSTQTRNATGYVPTILAKST